MPLDGKHTSFDSRKEQEVIEKQRKLAASIARRPVQSKTTSVTSKKIHVQDSINDNDASVRSSASVPSTQKRPSTTKLKRPSSSASAVLAAARARATSRGRRVDSKDTSERSKQGDDFKQKTNSVKLQRKEKPEKEGSSRLASLVLNVANKATKLDDNFNSSAYGTNFSPEDFWKNLRDWDFANAIANEENPSRISKKPVPDVFISVRHYISQWAPLCMAETRAQLLAEITTDCSQSSRGPCFFHVNVETTWKTGGRRDRSVHKDLIDMDSCLVKIRPRERNIRGGPFYANDIFCLIRSENKDAVELILRGRKLANTDAIRKCCLIGHSEVQRKDIDGLILKVSKKKWAQIGTQSMYLLRVGGNITALREFTALCAIETLPLKRYLLGQHLEAKTFHSSGLASSNGRDLPIQKEALLRKMGGVQALGKGFTDYAQKKFNPSQLRAISASAHGYGEGGITLIKGPPGTGKTTTLVAVLNSLHIRQYNKYYDEVRRIAAMQTGNRQSALDAARKSKPRLLVCAPSNAAVDNICLKIFEDGFVDGSGQRYNPSMIRVGIGQSAAVESISLETKINQILAEIDLGQLDSSIAGFRMELQRISTDIVRLRRRCHAIASASPWPLGKDWEIRVDEDTFDTSGRCFFVNHRDQTTTFECPPPPEPGETQFPARSMPEYRAFMQRIVKSVETYFSIKSNLERNVIVKGSLESGANNFTLRQSLESHVLNSVHMVMTTLGTAGNRVFEGTDRFEVVVIDEAAQSVEPATLSALRLGSRHCILVGDPQQLPATIFNVSGRNSKYDRSLFQRLEEAGQEIHMLNEQYRMHPKISHFPRHIFYGGNLLDGPNVVKKKYGEPLLNAIGSNVPTFQPLTILDLDSKEERGGTSLSNSTEAELAVHLYTSMNQITNGLSSKSRVALITPYSQQANLLKRFFRNQLGSEFARFVEINTVDAFQGREANIVIFSAVRAAGSHGIGFLSDVRRMNVALTRAKHFLFVIARCKSIVVNPYWKDLVNHARESHAVVTVPLLMNGNKPQFGHISSWEAQGQPFGRKIAPIHRPADPRKRKRGD